MTFKSLLVKLKKLDKQLNPAPWNVPDKTQGCQSVWGVSIPELFYTNGFPDYPREGEALAELRNLVPKMIAWLEDEMKLG